MRSQNRKLTNQPIKSPSPDVGHRSIIINTKSPVSEIYQYGKMRDNSNSPRRSNMSISYIDQNGIQSQQQIERLKRIIKDLQSRLQPLQKLNISQGELISQNTKLRQQITMLKQQLNNRPSFGSGVQPSKNGFNIVIPSPKACTNTPGTGTFNQGQKSEVPSSLNNDSIMRQFNQRLWKMSEQNKRLMKLIEQYKLKNDGLQLQNYRLKQSSAGQMYSNNNSSNQIERLKIYFNQKTTAIMNQTINKCEVPVKIVQSRLIKLEDSQNKISMNSIKKRQHSRSSSPFQINKANQSTDAKTDFLDYHPAHVDMVQSKYTVSPRQTKNFSIDSPIREAQQQNSSMRRQKQQLETRIKNLLNQVQNLKRQNNRLSVFDKSRQSISNESSKQRQISKVSKLQKFYQQKSEGLQNQIRNKIAQLKFKERTVQDLQKRLKDANTYIQKQLPCYEKVIEQQKQKNLYYESELQKQSQKSRQYQQKIQYLSQQLTIMLQKTKLLQKTLFQKDQTKTDMKDLNELLKSYYLRIVAIRQNMSGEQIQLQLNEVQSKWDSYSQLRTILESLANDYEILVQKYKREKFQMNSSIIELERQNNMLKVQIQQIKIQKQRLKGSIQIYKTPVKQFSDINYKKLLNQHESKNNDCRIRNFISESVGKLTQLQRQIQRKIQSGNTKY